MYNECTTVCIYTCNVYTHAMDTHGYNIMQAETMQVMYLLNSQRIYTPC